MLTALGTLAAAIPVLLTLCVFLLAATLVHEAGHIAAGLLAGFEIVGVQIGPVRLRRGRAKEWSVDGRWRIGGMVTVQSPKIPGPRVSWQFAVFLLGGPLANLGLSAVLAPFSFNRTLGSAIIGYFMAVSGFVGIVNLVPFKFKSVCGDGAGLLWLLLSGEGREMLAFRLSIKPRMEELKSLFRERRFEAALAKVDDFIDRSSAEPGLPGVSIHRLLEFRGRIEKAVNARADGPIESVSAPVEPDRENAGG